MGTICSIFPGETFEGCYDKTSEQLNGQYWEALRQEARVRLRDLENQRAVQDPEYFKHLEEQLKQRAEPPDPESDGHFGKDSIRVVRRIFGGDQLKGDEGKRTIKKNARHP